MKKWHFCRRATTHFAHQQLILWKDIGKMKKRHWKDTCKMKKRHWKDAGQMKKQHWKDAGKINKTHWKDAGKAKLWFPEGIVTGKSVFSNNKMPKKRTFHVWGGQNCCC